MVCYNYYHSEDTIFLDIPIGLHFQLRPNTIMNSEPEVDFAMLFTLRESRRTSDPVLSRDQCNRLQFQP